MKGQGWVLAENSSAHGEMRVAQDIGLPHICTASAVANVALIDARLWSRWSLKHQPHNSPVSMMYNIQRGASWHSPTGRPSPSGEAQPSLPECLMLLKQSYLYASWI